MLEVASAYLLATVLVGCALLAAVAIALVVGRRAGIHGRIALLVVGVLLLGISGLERAGWSARPWRVGSPAQEFDDLLFRVVWLTGAGFIFLAAALRLIQKPNGPPRVNGEREIVTPRLVSRN